MATINEDAVGYNNQDEIENTERVNDGRTPTYTLIIADATAKTKFGLLVALLPTTTTTTTTTIITTTTDNNTTWNDVRENSVLPTENHGRIMCAECRRRRIRE